MWNGIEAFHRVSAGTYFETGFIVYTHLLRQLRSGSLQPRYKTTATI